MPSLGRSTPVSKGNEFDETTEFTAWQVNASSRKIYHVFINHCGRDVKATLASLIYHHLVHRRLKVFLDNKAMLHGEAIPLAIHTPIRSASLHIVIFSKHYAESAWCLRELCLMVDSGPPIIPVFCDIRPSDLRMEDEGGPYIEDFRKHRSVENAETVEKWRAALWRVSYHYGFQFGGDQGMLLEEISESVMKHVNFKVRLEVDGTISCMFCNAL